MADPLYQRIANDLRTQIETGQLQPGAQLPPEEQLGKLFKASRNTIRDAIKFLISLGLVETRAGQGTFVVDPPDPLVTKLTSDSPGLGGGEGAAYLSEASERHPRSDIPTVELQTALGEIAYRLGVPEGTPVVSRTSGALSGPSGPISQPRWTATRLPGRCRPRSIPAASPLRERSVCLTTKTLLRAQSNI